MIAEKGEKIRKGLNCRLEHVDCLTKYFIRNQCGTIKIFRCLNCQLTNLNAHLIAIKSWKKTKIKKQYLKRKNTSRSKTLIKLSCDCKPGSRAISTEFPLMGSFRLFRVSGVCLDMSNVSENC